MERPDSTTISMFRSHRNVVMRPPRVAPVRTDPRVDHSGWAVENYEVFSLERRVAYGARGRCWTTSQIQCAGVDGVRMLLVFFDPKRTKKTPSNGGGVMFLPAPQYQRVTELLRREVPLPLDL